MFSASVRLDKFGCHFFVQFRELIKMLDYIEKPCSKEKNMKIQQCERSIKQATASPFVCSSMCEVPLKRYQGNEQLVSNGNIKRNTRRHLFEILTRLKLTK